MTRTALARSTPDLLNWQNDCIRTAEYDVIGTMWCVVLEAEKSVQPPGPEITSVMGLRLEWYSSGLPIAQTKDHSTLLVLAPVLDQEGQVGLPWIPDPRWKPKFNPHFDGNGKIVFDEPNKVRQPLEERCRAILKGTNFLVFGPIAQVLIREKDVPAGIIATCYADPGTRTQMDLLIDAKTGEAHFYGGRFQLNRAG